jgi:membrane-associated phospholipid phosphatase
VEAVFFLYFSALAAFWPLQPGMRARILGSTLATFLIYGAVLWRRPKWAGYFRDWASLALLILAYRQVGWFAPAARDYTLERAFIPWDRALLSDWGLRVAIESLGPAIPVLLDVSYLLVYAVGPTCLALLYAYRKPELTDQFMTTYALGVLIAYAQHPFWPSEPPWTVFPGEDFPSSITFVRRSVESFLGNLGAHTSVFPSSHVSGAFAAAFVLPRLLPEKRAIHAALPIYAVVMATATVYGRYHYGADALAGFGVAAVAAILGRAIERAKR